jgi:hypothetical protein
MKRVDLDRKRKRKEERQTKKEKVFERKGVD